MGACELKSSRLNKYSGSHIISYRLIKYLVYYHTNLKSKSIFYAFPYIILRFIEFHIPPIAIEKLSNFCFAHVLSYCRIVILQFLHLALLANS